MSVERADVLVVGLGPAGSCAAAAAARAGARVIAVDRRHEPGLPVQCAEFVPALIGIETGALAGAVRQSIASMMTFVEDEAPDLTDPFPGKMLDRAAFDAALVREAAGAGAQCRFATTVRKIGANARVMLAEGAVIEAAVIVGADGPRSVAGRAIKQVNAALVETRQVTVPLLRAHDATDIFLSASIPGGYGWLFPKGPIANLGAGVDPAHRQRLRGIVQRLHSSLVASGRVGPEVLNVTGGAIPVGGMLIPHAQLGSSHVLLAGDAAGLANPVTGAGIAAAVYSGKLAGEAAGAIVRGDRGAARAYEEELRDVLGVALDRAVRRRAELTRATAGGAGRDALRRGWIAYPQYWATP
ncbi:MAG TPA: NAD(P)/FAD-dependent oxidoreductase [Casimicrobiaceae bacterium]|nr:NAD(P)/FAD-dependent oxidoreductase [Casimicrobiaceae bacterium]